MPSQKRAKANRAEQVQARRAMRGIRRRLSPNLIVTSVVLAVVLIVGGAVWLANRGGGGAATASERLVRVDSHKLTTAADGKVTVVEFLDFECGSCLAAFPHVERLRAEYAGRFTYVMRYFPLPSHPNGMPAALAAQAAANQGKLEPMYRKLFETQQAWGGKQDNQSALFESYAGELGLDLTRFKADVADAATRSRVQADVADGEALGVTGTPTFFVNGAKFTGRPDYAGLKAAVDKALAS